MLDAYIKLNSKVHDIFSNSRHEILFTIDLKYAYFIISLIEKCRHYFVSIISEIDQIQSTCMQQESMRAEFTLTENVYKIFKCISTSNFKSFF